MLLLVNGLSRICVISILFVYIELLLIAHTLQSTAWLRKNDPTGESRRCLLQQIVGESRTASISIATVDSLYKNESQSIEHHLEPTQTIASKNDTTTTRKKNKKKRRKKKKQREFNAKLTDPLKESCGRVPVFEKLYHKSYNASQELTESGDWRILYGLDATPGEWPWIVRIKICSNNRDTDCSYCTGSILNSRWIITAGHCSSGRTDPKNFKAIIGQYDLVVPDASSRTVTFDKIILHPKYRELNNDLTLMRLEHSLEFNDFVQPICLVGPNHDTVRFTQRLNCTTIGYGLMADLEEAIKLQKLAITARDPAECNGDQFNNIKLKPDSICIGPVKESKGSSCKGDSGGPNQCYEPKSNRWLLFGTVSYGPSNCDRDQGDKWLSVGVDLAKHSTWIRNTMVADTNMVSPN